MSSGGWKVCRYSNNWLIALCVLSFYQLLLATQLPAPLSPDDWEVLDHQILIISIPLTLDYMKKKSKCLMLLFSPNEL